MKGLNRVKRFSREREGERERGGREGGRER